MNQTTIPKHANKVAIRPLALGEVSGHHHSLYAPVGMALEDAVEMFETTDDAGTTLYVRVTSEGVSLQHQEHKTSPIPPGEYEVRIQTEVTDWGKSPVQD
jgi:hypothetical protein